MTQAYEHLQGDANLWQRFSRYDKVAPGQAEGGMLHLSPTQCEISYWS